jgi:hypothetical protein
MLHIPEIEKRQLKYIKLAQLMCGMVVVLSCGGVEGGVGSIA